MNTNTTQSWDPTWKDNLLFNSVAFIVDSIARSQLATIRTVHVNSCYPFERLQAEEGFIVSMWHENIFLASRLLKEFKLTILASASKDGEFAVRFAQHAGHDTIRGSSSRGGSRALKQLIRLGREGKRLVIMPDGPRGPAKIAQGGVVAMAQMTGLPIVPFHWTATRQHRFKKSWDGQKVAKLASTIIISWGDPIHIPKKLNSNEQLMWLKKIEDAMNKNVEHSENLACEITNTIPVPFIPRVRKK